MRTGEKL